MTTSRTCHVRGRQRRASALIVAVCGSAMAGLVHAAAARATRAIGSSCGCSSCAPRRSWAGRQWSRCRPRRVVLVAGVVINGGAVLVWALTRTVGISFVDSLAEVETVGTQDLAAALLAAASVLGAVCMLARPVARTTIAPMWAGALAVVALLGTMPALRADHTHHHGGHTELDVAGHAHGDGDEHGHESAAGDSAAHDEHADEDHAHDDSAGGGDDTPTTTRPTTATARRPRVTRPAMATRPRAQPPTTTRRARRVIPTPIRRPPKVRTSTPTSPRSRTTRTLLLIRTIRRPPVRSCPSTTRG